MELLNERFARTLSKTNHFIEKSEALIRKGRPESQTTWMDTGYEKLEHLIPELNEFLSKQGKLKDFDRWYLEFKTLGKEPPKEFYTLLKAFQNQHDVLK